MSFNEYGVELPLTPVVVRDRDIRLAAAVRSLFDDVPDTHFTLTGSYSVEALTQRPVYHNDIDANILTTDVARAMAATAVLMDSLDVHGSRVQLLNQSRHRLDFIVETDASGAGSRTIELQCIEAKAASVRAGASGLDFVVRNHENYEARVPTVIASLTDSSGEQFLFRVKSLPYAIATWALRISGVAESQKRAVRNTDLGHFGFLLATDHEDDEVASAMLHHPQMPAGYSPEQVLSQAAGVIRKFNDDQTS